MKVQLLFPYLFFFGVQLEALVQGAAMLLQVLLLLTPHALGIFHHFLLDAAKQTDGQTQAVTSGGELKFGVFFALWKRTGDTKDNWADNNCRLNSWYARRDEMLKPLTILSFCSPTRSRALCVEALLSRRV